MTPARESFGVPGDRPGIGVGEARGRWPFVDPDPLPLAPTLPDGSAWPRITVVTPSFNQGAYIERTILSVLNQGYPDVEHIVIDGGSTDDTTRVLDAYRSRLALVVSEPDKGQSDAINKGFRASTGRILTWLNSDDMLAPGALAAGAMALWHSGADMVAGVCELYKDERLLHRHLTSCASGPLPLGDLLDLEGCWLRGQFFYQPEVLFTRELWERAGGRVREDAFYSMDYELWLRFAHARARLHVIGSPIAHFRVHDAQKTAVASNYQSELPGVRDAFAREHGIDVPPPRPAGRDRLRVALFNDIGYTYGAGIAHRRVGAALVAAGHDVVTIAATNVHPHREEGRVTATEAMSAIRAAEPDLVVVGNLHGAGVSPEVLGVIAEAYPTLFVLHDLWLLTGRCAYPGPCEQYLLPEGCSPSCTCAPGYPALAQERVGPAWRSKRRVLSSSASLTLAGDSRFVADVARRAVASDQLCAVTRTAPEIGWLKYGFETDVLRPRDRRVCREMLGLPQDRFIVMSSASSLDDARKGLSHLAEAMEILAIPDSLVVCVGHLPADQAPPIPGMRAMGYMDDPVRLAMLYSACDVFVGPSLEEAFGQVFVEAAACGTPAIGYPVGGVPEAITHGVTGLVADRTEPAALARAIDALYRDPIRRDAISRSAPIHVRNEWSIVAAAHRLVQVLRETGLEDRLGLGRKLAIHSTSPEMPEPRRLAVGEPAWRAVSGFDAWEGPYPKQGLPRCRWMLGGVGCFEIGAQVGGAHRLVIRYRNFEPGQRVRLIGAHGEVMEHEVPVTAPGAKPLLVFAVTLEPGMNRLELHAWKWKPGARPMSILLTNVRAIPSPALQARPTGGGARATEPKPRPARA